MSQGAYFTDESWNIALQHPNEDVLGLIAENRSHYASDPTEPRVDAEDEASACRGASERLSAHAVKGARRVVG